MAGTKQDSAGFWILTEPSVNDDFFHYISRQYLGEKSLKPWRAYMEGKKRTWRHCGKFWHLSE